MNEAVEVIDMLLSPEVAALAVGVVGSGVGAPVAIGVGVVAVVGAAFLPKPTAKKLIDSMCKVLRLKRK